MGLILEVRRYRRRPEYAFPYGPDQRSAWIVQRVAYEAAMLGRGPVAFSMWSSCQGRMR